jgi:hypothetical protein
MARPAVAYPVLRPRDTGRGLSARAAGAGRGRPRTDAGPTTGFRPHPRATGAQFAPRNVFHSPRYTDPRAVFAISLGGRAVHPGNRSGGGSPPGPVRFRAQPVRGFIWSRPGGFFGGFHAQTTSEHVQPCASTAFDRQRSQRLALELPILLRTDRTRSDPLAAASEIPRHAQVHALRALRPLHRGSRVAYRSPRCDRGEESGSRVAAPSMRPPSPDAGPGTGTRN